MGSPRLAAPFVIALYSDAPQAGKSTAAKVLNNLSLDARYPTDVLSFAFPIRRAVRPLLPISWDSETVRAHLSGPLKDKPIPELGGKCGRDLLKLIGNTARKYVRDDIWTVRLFEEIARLTYPGVVIIDDLRYEHEYERTGRENHFRVRLLCDKATMPRAFDSEEVDGRLFHHSFDAVVPAKGLVPQEVFEKLIADLWTRELLPRIERLHCDVT